LDYEYFGSDSVRISTFSFGQENSSDHFRDHFFNSMIAKHSKQVIDCPVMNKRLRIHWSGLWSLSAVSKLVLFYRLHHT